MVSAATAVSSLAVDAGVAGCGAVLVQQHGARGDVHDVRRDAGAEGGRGEQRGELVGEDGGVGSRRVLGEGGEDRGGVAQLGQLGVVDRDGVGAGVHHRR